MIGDYLPSPPSNIFEAFLRERRNHFRIHLTDDEVSDVAECIIECISTRPFDLSGAGDMGGFCRIVAKAFTQDARPAWPAAGPKEDKFNSYLAAIQSTGLSPYSFLRLSIDLRGTAIDKQWRRIFSAIAALSAADNHFVCTTFAHELGEADNFPAALRWTRRAITILTDMLNAPGPERPNEDIARDIWVLGGIYAQAAQYQRKLNHNDDAVRSSFLAKLAHVNIPNFSQFTENIKLGSDPYKIPYDYWVKKYDIRTHPDITNVISYYLQIPFQQTKLDRLPATSSVEVFPAAWIDMPAGHFTGIKYQTPERVWQEAGTIHTVRNVRAYVDQWQTSVFSYESGYLPELSHGHGALAYAADRLNLLRPDAHDLKIFDGPVAIVSKCSAWEWYSHWLHEILPMVGMLLDQGIDFDFLIAQKSNNAWCRQGFEALGIEQHKIVNRDNFIYLSAKEAIIPRAAISRTGNAAVSDYAYSFVRSLFLANNVRSTQGRRIFISRGKARSRHLVNENELVELLGMRGFETVFLEDLAIRDTARLLAEAEIVLSTHGAGMANLCFCAPGTPVIELRPTAANYWIQLLCACFKLPYYCVDAIPNDDGREIDVYSDVRIDTNIIRSLLDYLKIERRFLQV